MRLSPVTLSFLLLFATIGISLSQSRSVGVQEGDYFRYAEFKVNWTSTDPNATFPPHGRESIAEMNRTQWMMLSVQNITHTFIFFKSVKNFEDGTERIKEGFVDVDTGKGEMGLFAISANLHANSSVYAEEPYSKWYINWTAVRDYPDGSRETNHLNMTWEHSWIINETTYYSKNYYWDRSTGILVEHSYEEIEQTEEGTTTLTISYELVESNLWNVPELSTLTSILILIVTTIVVFVYNRDSKLRIRKRER